MTSAAAPVALRAVLFATPPAAADLPVPADFPAALLPVGHATLVERLVEQLVRVGVKDIDIVVCHRPELLRRELGDGERWGAQFRWHLAKDPARPYGMLRSAPSVAAGRVLIGHADRWLDPAAITHLAAVDHLLLHLDAADAPAWTGWASLPADKLPGISTDGDERALGAALEQAGVSTEFATGGGAPLLTGSRLLMLQQQVVGGSQDAPLPLAWIPKPWGAMSPLARLHPDAEVVGPALIGPGCLVAAGARIGRHVVLSRDVVVDDGTSVRDAVILPGSYLGRELDVHDAIVNGGRIAHVALGVETVLPQSEGLAMSLDGSRAAGPSLAGRLAAAVAALVLAPVVAAATLLRRNGEPALPWTPQPVVVGLDPVTRQIAVAPLRCSRAGGSAWRRWAAHYGGLLDVVQGRRCWFGVRPRRSGEWYALSAEWQSLLASAPIGLLNAPAWSGDDGIRQEAGAAADAFYAVRRSWRENLRVARAAICSGAAG